MHPEVKRVLDRITARLPAHLRDKLVKVEVDDQEQALVDHALSSVYISEDKKRELRKLKAKGAFKPIMEEVVDEDIEKEIDAYYERAIADAIRSGELPPAGDNDAWFQKRAGKIRASAV